MHGAAQLSSFNFLTELLPEYFVYRTRKNLSAQRRQSQSLFCSFLAHSFLTNLLSRLSFLSPKENIEECHSQYHGLALRHLEGNAASIRGIEAFGRRRCFNPNPHTTCRPPLMKLKQTCLVVIHLTRDKHGGRVASGHNRRDLLQAAAS